MVLLPCGKCCNVCGCEKGRPPYTVTLTPDGFTGESLDGYFPAVVFTPELFDAVFSDPGPDPLFNPGYGRLGTGSGAIIWFAVAPDGKFAGYKIIDGGSGYATKGRVEPTLTITVPGMRGTSCTITPTLVEDVEWILDADVTDGTAIPGQDIPCRKAWNLTGITVAGCEEIEGEQCGTVVLPAKVRAAGGRQAAASRGGFATYIRFATYPPTLTTSVSGGDGAVLAVEMECRNSDSEDPSIGDVAFYVASVTVEDGGQGYTDGSPVQFSTPHMGRLPSATVRTVPAQPEASVSVVSFANGEGAEFSVAFSEVEQDERTRWTVSGVSVVSGGTGYAVGDQLRVSLIGNTKNAIDGLFVPPPHVSSVSNGGAITGISFVPNAECTAWTDTGVIESVDVTDGGDCYHGIPTELVLSVNGEGPGFSYPQYYAESDDEPPCVEEVFGHTNQWNGPVLWDQILACEVSTNTEDGTFGKIVAAEFTRETWVPDLYSTTVPISDYWQVIPSLPRVFFAEQSRQLVKFPVTASFGDGALLAFSYLTLGNPFYGGVPEDWLHLVAQRLAPQLVVDEDFHPPRRGVFEFTLEQATAEAPESHSRDEHPAWTISAVTATGGCGYQNGAQLPIVIDEGVHPFRFDQFGIPPSWFPAAVDTQPDITITTDGGGRLTGATINDGGKFWLNWPWDGAPTGIDFLSVVAGGSGYAVYGREQPQNLSFSPAGPWAPTFEQHEDEHGRPYWSIESIAVGNGSGYADGQGLSINATWPTVVESFAAKIFTKRVQPTITANIKDGVGQGAVLAVTLAEVAGSDSKFWEIASIAVTNGGQQYLTTQTEVQISVTNGVAVSPATATATIGPNGVVQSVEVSTGSAYYATNNVADRVEVTTPGVMWRENKSLPPHVADITITVEQKPPSNGSGCEVGNVVVNTDTQSPDFGKIVRVESVTPGSGYLPYESFGCVLRDACRINENGAVYPGRFTVKFNSSGIVSLDYGYSFIHSRSSAATVGDCTAIESITLSGLDEATFTLTPGGTANPYECDPRIPQPEETCLPDGKPSLDLHGTASITLTIPNMEVPFGGADWPMCGAGQYSAEVELKTYCGEDPTIWLTGSKKMSDPPGLGGGQVDLVTCSVTVGCVDGDVFVAINFTSGCAETWDGDGIQDGLLLQKQFGFFYSKSPIEYTVNEGIVTPDAVSISETYGPVDDNENEFPFTAEITFANG